MTDQKRPDDSAIEPPHWQRVREERAQLSERIDKLESFLCSSNALRVASHHLILLRLQLAIMKQYEGVLGDRIDLWEKERSFPDHSPEQRGQS